MACLQPATKLNFTLFLSTPPPLTQCWPGGARGFRSRSRHGGNFAAWGEGLKLGEVRFRGGWMLLRKHACPRLGRLAVQKLANRDRDLESSCWDLPARAVLGTTLRRGVGGESGVKLSFVGGGCNFRKHAWPRLRWPRGLAPQKLANEQCFGVPSPSGGPIATGHLPCRAPECPPLGLVLAARSGTQLRQRPAAGGGPTRTSGKALVSAAGFGPPVPPPAVRDLFV